VLKLGKWFPKLGKSLEQQTFKSIVFARSRTFSATTTRLKPLLKNK
jgi:hypothetical protein